MDAILNDAECAMKKTARQYKYICNWRDTISDTNDLFIICVLRDYCYEFVYFVDCNLECEFDKSQA